MAYRLLKERTFATTATLMVPGDDGPQRETMTVRFKLIPDYEQLGTMDFLRLAVLNLGDIVDDDGEPVPFTPELLEAVLGEPWARVGLVRAYWETVTGAAVKN